MTIHTRSLADIYNINASLVSLGLSDLSNEDATHRTRNGEGSSISFITGHLLLSRVGLLKTLGAATENPYSGMFSPGSPTPDGSDYPHVTELASQWEDVHARLSTALAGLTDDDVLAEHDGLPIPDDTVRGAIMFRAWHESYHVGQIALLRTELGRTPLITLFRNQSGGDA
jgi:uncharacterized damage-inducible protein DinB